MIAFPDPRLAAQIAFVVEIDKLKGVLRQTLLMDSSRRENDAEHSWHIATMSFLLAEYADQPVEIGRVARMLLIHDIVEIDAGDTFIHDEAGHEDKEERERKAAARLFGLLPADQAGEYSALWQEYEARQTADARFADALDRLQPLLHNFETGGATWKPHGVTRAKVDKLTPRIAAGSKRLGAYARALVDEAVRRGYLAP
ncbi:HD domain-containing protein [Paramagnetospirillum magneticum]|uniref:Predicted hydrolase of HD superfamily n=1 Tax=Paramagnetospirillum magneticum (strain ATCC 700264 / AMB-1) TaxID=342108 RepID=Q2VZ21_PARM1|nr:HD domain-containing protein [Paramagnetospirillum magneticum]BAE53154.1 Predicted hydrolase of HD superfamily [Paramagnetospirillum magneticum AMB-1]